MRKSLIALVVAGLAAATAVTPAQAKGKGFGVGLGVGLIVGGIIASQHHQHHQRTYVRPVQPQPYPAASRPAQPAAPAIRTADDQGRFYDLASKTWFDGQDQCFTGANGWSVKGGAWFYGTAPWSMKDGVWQAATGVAPTPVDCAAVPAIASRMPKQSTDKTAVVTMPSSEDHAAATLHPDSSDTPPPASAGTTIAGTSPVGTGGAGKAE